MKAELKEIIENCDVEIEDIKKRIELLPSFDKLKIYLTQYALIKTCGTVEYVYRSIVADYFDRVPVPQIHTYIDKQVREGSNSAKYDNMSALLNKFDERWAKNFKEEVGKHEFSKRLIDSSNSLVTNRHLFAHGRVPVATFQEIYQYYKDVLILINILDSVINEGVAV